ncbi:hypothetical protein [Geomonas sp. Red276]
MRNRSRGSLLARGSVAVAALSLGLLVLAAGPAEVGAEPGWMPAFEETCNKTSVGMSLTVPELTALLEKCAELEKSIQAEEETTRKVYLKRLQLCRNLFAYLLDYKKNQQPAKE